MTIRNQVVTGEKWVNLLQNHDSDTLKLQLRRKTNRIKATTAEAGVSEGPKAERSKSTDWGSKNSTKESEGRSREDANEKSSHQQDSTTGSESESSDSHRNELALVNFRPRSAQEPNERSSRELVLYKRLDPVPHSTSTISLPQENSQNCLNSLAMTPPGSPDSHESEQKSEERRLIVFDRAAIQPSPEIYSPPSRPVVRFHVPEKLHRPKPETISVYSVSEGRASESSTEDESGDSASTDTSEDDEPSQIAIPHFLSWATNPESTLQESLSESSIESILKILQTVHEKLQTGGRLKHGRAYRKSEEMERFELEGEFPSLKQHESKHNPHNFHTVQEKEGDHIPILPLMDAQNDIIRLYLLKACNAKLRNLYTIWTGFLSLYFPLSSPLVSGHPLVRKCWGAFRTIVFVSRSTSRFAGLLILDLGYHIGSTKGASRFELQTSGMVDRQRSSGSKRAIKSEKAHPRLERMRDMS